MVQRIRNIHRQGRFPEQTCLLFFAPYMMISFFFFCQIAQPFLSKIKATFDDHELPKKKHTYFLKGQIQSFVDGPNFSEFNKLLAKRLQSDSWKVVLKTLVVIHMFLREAKPGNFCLFA